jgi:lactate permease
MNVFIALSPIILIILLLLFRKPLMFAAPITFFYTLFLSVFVWRQRLSYTIASMDKALFVAIDIGLIIFGAIFFLELLKRTGLMQTIQAHLQSVTPDIRLQVIILVWFFGSFIEGTAGFGTPAAIVAPLLVGLGFAPLSAVILALLGNNAAVTFGAVGTPIRIGLAGLDSSGVAFYTALITGISSILIPIIILYAIVKLEKKDKSYFFEALPFAIWAGICFAVPFFMMSFIGVEFPSLVGPLIGLFIIILTTKLGWFVPNRIYGRKIVKTNKSLIYALSPYALLVILLFVGKNVLPSFKLIIFESFSHTFNLFNPGLIFLMVILIIWLVLRIPNDKVYGAFLESKKILLKPIAVILCITAFVQLMVTSNQNHLGIEGMLTSISSLLYVSFLPLVSPFIGAFGSFLAGSATVSTLLFAGIQFTAATAMSMSGALILALQISGAAAGNMVALSNIVAAQATVGLHGKESEIFRFNLLPCLFYTLVLGLVGLLIFVLM